MAAVAVPFPQMSNPVSPFKLIRWVSRAALTPAQLKVAVWLIDHGYQGRFNGGIGAICRGLGLRDRSWVRELIQQISTKLCGGLQVLHFPGRANLYVFDQTQLLLFNQHANLVPRSQTAAKPIGKTPFEGSAPSPRSDMTYDKSGFSRHIAHCADVAFRAVLDKLKNNPRAFSGVSGVGYRKENRGVGDDAYQSYGARSVQVSPDDRGVERPPRNDS
jgi:hypothetical protein